MWYQNWAKNGGDLCNFSTKEADRFAQFKVTLGYTVRPCLKHSEQEIHI